MLASCSKDEDDQIPQVTAQELVGTWEFQNPTLAEVVVEGSNMKMVNSLKEELTSQITENKAISPETITFKSDMTCTATKKRTDGSFEGFKGTYTVANGRLSAKITGLDNSQKTKSLTGQLVKKGADIFLVIDTKSIQDKLNDRISNPNSSVKEIAISKEMLAAITEVRCPLKLVKAVEQTPTIYVTAKEIIGTWEFQNPTLAEVVVEGSDKELVSSNKKDITDGIASGSNMISDVITFKSDMTCTATETRSDGTIEAFKGTYTVTNGRLVVSYTGIDSHDHEFYLSGALESKGGSIYLVVDKQSMIDRYNQILSDPDLSKDDIADFTNLRASFTTGISNMRCPLKMAKTVEQIPTYNVIAKEIAGTWMFQNPTVAEVIVEGSNKELASQLKKDLTDEIGNGKSVIPEVITFNSDMTCTATQNRTDGSSESYKGTYAVINSRLSGKIFCEGNADLNRDLTGKLEKKGNDIYLVYDKQMALESFASMIADPRSSAAEIAEYKATVASITTGISILRCPMKMVKK